MAADSSQSDDGRKPGSVAALVIAVLVGLSAVGAAASIIYFLLFNVLSNSSRTAADFARLEKAALQILLFSIAVGVIAMAVLEAVKRLTPIRAVYHLRALTSRLGAGSTDFLSETISHGRRRTTPFDLPVEQLTAQIGAALDQIVSSIEMLPLAWQPVEESAIFDGVVSPLVHQRLQLVNAIIGREFFTIAPPAPDGSPAPASPTEDTDLRRDMEAILRVALDAGLDNLQLSIGSDWKRLVRLSASIISAVSALAVSVLYGVDVTVLLVSAVGAFVLGGFFAWLSRDLTAVIERWRR